MLNGRKKVYKNQSPQKAGTEKGNIVGGQADRLKDFAARQECEPDKTAARATANAEICASVLSFAALAPLRTYNRSCPVDLKRELWRLHSVRKAYVRLKWRQLRSTESR